MRSGCEGLLYMTVQHLPVPEESLVTIVPIFLLFTTLTLHERLSIKNTMAVQVRNLLSLFTTQVQRVGMNIST